MTTRKPSTRKTAARKPRTHKSSTLITIVADEAVVLWDAMTDAVTAAQIRALLPDRIQFVAAARSARPVPKPTVPKPTEPKSTMPAVARPQAAGRAAA